MLAGRGGSARERVLSAVGELRADRLTDLDRESLQSGGVRWETWVHQARVRLVRRALVKASSRRGIWELIEAEES